MFFYLLVILGVFYSLHEWKQSRRQQKHEEEQWQYHKATALRDGTSVDNNGRVYVRRFDKRTNEPYVDCIN